MLTKKLVNKKIIISIIFLSCILLCILVSKQIVTSQNTDSSIEVSSTPQDILTLGEGYSLGVDVSNKSKSVQSVDKVNGLILLDDSQDIFECSFTNNTDEEQFILKVFYDYEEVEFTVPESNQYNTTYLFDLPRGNSIVIPIKLNESILKDTMSHKLTIGIYANPKEFTKNQKIMSNFFGTTLDYEISYQEGNREISLKESYSEPSKALDNIDFSGLVINNNVDNFEEISLPPYSIQVKKGEKVNLSYFVNLIQSIPEEVESYLILSMLNWEQVQMNDQPYLLLDTVSLGTEYGTFYITAPDEEGLYEFVSYVVPNPENNKNEDNFYPIETAYRFTIEVIQ